MIVIVETPPTSGTPEIFRFVELNSRPNGRFETEIVVVSVAMISKLDSFPRAQ